MRTRIIAITAGFAVIIGLGVWAALAPGAEHEIGSYATGLRGRTPSQIHNLVLACRRINGTVVMPGQVFSFNRTVGPWTADVGYEKAPVSYDGELIRSWGGGVCQASSTLYNAALLAGLDVIERHRHHWPARYAPLGRDAAVAYSDIDLKFKNNLTDTIRITAQIRGETLVFRMMSRYKPGYSVQVDTEIRSVTKPGEIVQDRTAAGRGRWKLVNRGHPGFYVVTYRRFIYPNETRRQLLSQDEYPAMNRVMRIAER